MTTAEVVDKLRYANERGDKQEVRRLAELLAANKPAVKSTFAGGGVGTAAAWWMTTQWPALAAASDDVKIIIGGAVVTFVGGLAGPVYRGVMARLERWEKKV